MTQISCLSTTCSISDWDKTFHSSFRRTMAKLTDRFRNLPLDTAYILLAQMLIFSSQSTRVRITGKRNFK